MASRGRPKTEVCEHQTPDANQYEIGEYFRCTKCNYRWIATKSPIGNKNFWKELGK